MPRDLEMNLSKPDFKAEFIIVIKAGLIKIVQGWKSVGTGDMDPNRQAAARDKEPGLWLV